MATIRERNGTYQITVYSGFDLNGRRKRETTTFTPPKELSPKKKEKVVQAFAIDYENRVKNGLVLAGEKTTLREFVGRWREEYASQNLEPGTLEKYNAEIDDKILPMLGHMILTEIKPHNVNAFYVSMTKTVSAGMGSREATAREPSQKQRMSFPPFSKPLWTGKS